MLVFKRRMQPRISRRLYSTVADIFGEEELIESILLLYKRNPSDEELLKDELCPCCRQDFISVKPASLGSEENV